MSRKGCIVMKDTRSRIKSVLASEGKTLKEVIQTINMRHPENTTTAQNVTNKLARKTIRFDEVSEIMDVLGYDIIFRCRDDNSEF